MLVKPMGPASNPPSLLSRAVWVRLRVCNSRRSRLRSDESQVSGQVHECVPRLQSPFGRQGMRMTDQEPPHPGEVLRHQFLRPLGISIADAARGLGVSRKALSRIVNGKTGISPEMALRLSVALETTPEYWMELQSQRELWLARQVKRLRKVRRLRDAQLPLFSKGRPDLHHR